MLLSTELSPCLNIIKYYYSTCEWYWPYIKLAILTLPLVIDLCIVLCFSFLLHHTVSASHPTFTKNKVRVYWLNVRRVKITGQRLKAVYCWLSLQRWQHAAFTHTLGLWSQLYPPSFTGLSTNVSHLAHCNLSRSALLKPGKQRRGEDLLNILTQPTPFDSDNSTQFGPKQ